MIGRVLPYGPGAVLAEIDQRVLPAEAATAVLRASLAGIDEVVAGAHTVLVRFDPTRTSARELERRLGEITIEGSRAPAPTPQVEIPVVYDGEDLPVVAALTGLSVAEVIERHSATTLTAAFCGFAPGFAYLVGLDPALEVPRRATPRPVVPCGAVAVAGPYSAVYPSASPGGWQLLGHTARRVWDAEAASPALLRPGTSVRFHPVASAS